MNDEIFFIPIEANKRKQEQKEQFDKIVNQIQDGINNLRTITSNDPKEQLFIDLFKYFIVGFDFNEVPYNIFLFNCKNELCLNYDLKTNELWCSYKHIWSNFYYKFDMKWAEVRLFINNQMRQHFKLNGITSRSVLSKSLF